MGRNDTTICVNREIKQRLEDIRPFESISWSEFLSELADQYEDNSGVQVDG